MLVEVFEFFPPLLEAACDGVVVLSCRDVLLHGGAADEEAVAVDCAVAWPVAALLLARLPPRERERLAVDVGI